MPAKKVNREARFIMAITPAEHKQIRVAAKKAGLKMSAWVRQELGLVEAAGK